MLLAWKLLFLRSRQRYLISSWQPQINVIIWAPAHVALPTANINSSQGRSRNAVSQILMRNFSSLIKEIKNAPSLLLSYTSKRGFLKTRESAEKHEPKASASRTSQVFLKIPKCLYNSTMLEEQVSLFLLEKVSWIARARTDDVGCVYYISTVHSCDVRRVLYGNIMNSFWPITAREFLWKFYIYFFFLVWGWCCYQWKRMHQVELQRDRIWTQQLVLVLRNEDQPTQTCVLWNERLRYSVGVVLRQVYDSLSQFWGVGLWSGWWSGCLWDSTL